MIIYLHGSDDYRIRQKLDQYISQFKEKYGSDLEIEKFDLAEKTGLEKARNFISISSMFGGYKLAVLDDIARLSDIQEFKDFIELSKLEGSEKEILIMIDISLSQTGWQSKKTKKEEDLKKYFSLIAKESIELNIFGNFSEFKKWVEEELKKTETKIEEKAVWLLFENLGDNTWRLIGELEKLSLYKKDGSISEGDILEICDLKSQIYVFNIFDAFFSRDKKRSILLYNQALQSGIEAQAIFNLFVDQIRTAAYIVSNKREFLAGAKPFKIRKIEEKLGNFSKEQILNIFQVLADSDWAIKNGRIDFESAMEYILLNF